MSVARKDDFAAVDVSGVDIGPFVPYDGQTYPILRELTVAYCRINTSVGHLKPARSCLGDAKGRLLEDAFKRKWGHIPEDGQVNTDRLSDQSKRDHRRSPYQSARIALGATIAKVGEDARALLEAMKAAIMRLRNTRDTLERDLIILNVWVARRFLMEVQDMHRVAVGLLAQCPELTCHLWNYADPEQAFGRLVRDTTALIDYFAEPGAQWPTAVNWANFDRK